MATAGTSQEKSYPTEGQARAQIIQFGRLTYERRLLVAFDGNLSVVIGPQEILCTRSGSHNGFLTDDDLVVIDRQANKLRGVGRPTSEMAMHLACYANRPDIGAVIHAHPPMSIALTIAGHDLMGCVLPEVVLTLGTVPTIPYETTGTTALAESIGAGIRDHDALLMERHGAVTVGPDLLTAFARLETLEHTAHIIKAAKELGGFQEMSPAESSKLRALGLQNYGGPPSALVGLESGELDLPPACLVPGKVGEPRPYDEPGRANYSPDSVKSTAIPSSLSLSELTEEQVAQVSAQVWAALQVPGV